MEVCGRGDGGGGEGGVGGMSGEGEGEKGGVEDGEVVNLLITAGGTGFGVRDVTPEAVEGLVERKAGGLV